VEGQGGFERVERGSAAGLDEDAGAAAADQAVVPAEVVVEVEVEEFDAAGVEAVETAAAGFSLHAAAAERAEDAAVGEEEGAGAGLLGRGAAGVRHGGEGERLPLAQQADDVVEDWIHGSGVQVFRYSGVQVFRRGPAGSGS